ncbi:MAG: TonB-dependent receptor, partial [Gemmataceae bacterium]|nr:TonB-dependent receptor [Gemmataceae bacterium]
MHKRFHSRQPRLPIAFLGLLAFLSPLGLRAQSVGTIEGEVILGETGNFLRRVTVQIEELGLSTATNEEGLYRFENVPPGVYHLHAHLDSALTEEEVIVEVKPGAATRADIRLHLAVQRQEVVVTARGREESTFESFQSVRAVNSFELTESTAASLGEVLGNNPGSGIAKRSFGPGSSRPIIRGFDGDRVLIMQDGVRTGTLSSQSGDHGELINTATIDSLEVVKGPATLLYGSNALGGVVNAISRHHAIHEHPHQGFRGYATGSVGSADEYGGGGAGFEYGTGKWLLWGGGGGHRTDDYDTPIGTIFNSRTQQANGYVGLGWYNEVTFLNFAFNAEDADYGIPFAAEFEAPEEDGGGEEEEGEERIKLVSKRRSYEMNWGLLKLGSVLDSFRLKLSYTLWDHDEVEVAGSERTVGTAFEQEQFVYRGVFEQAPRGRLSGRFGFWGLLRDYTVAGEEALSPPVDQDAFAVFGLEEVSFERVKFEFGGRVERNHYDPLGPLPTRSFTGFSGAAGVRTDLWSGGALVVNYAHSHRAPALEELYNNGPHIGNLAFEVGDPTLTAETGDGVEFSLRQQHSRLRGELNFFYYSFDNFVFPAPTGETEDGLPVQEFTQLDARFVGSEANLGVALHPSLWLNLGADYVDAQETVTNTPLPRIPPLRGRAGFDWTYRGLSVKPEVVIANAQHQTFATETPTPG